MVFTLLKQARPRLWRNLTQENACGDKQKAQSQSTEDPKTSGNAYNIRNTNAAEVTTDKYQKIFQLKSNNQQFKLNKSNNTNAAEVTTGQGQEIFQVNKYTNQPIKLKKSKNTNAAEVTTGQPQSEKEASLHGWSLSHISKYHLF